MEMAEAVMNRVICRLWIVPTILSITLICLLLACGDDPPPPFTSPIPPDSSDCPPFDPTDYCAHTCTGLPPLNDLGRGTYRGVQGGLYPGGENARPPDHNTAGLALAGQIVPLSRSGVVDSANGAIVFLSIGMSNTQQEFRSFIGIMDTFQLKNPYLIVVNGAQGGWEINAILDSNAVFWTNITSELANNQVTNLQVQVIWFKEAEFQPASVAADTGFPGYADELKEKFKTAVNIVKDKFPNARLCYVASRIYGGYDVTTGNPEPFAYYTGWAVKRLIEDQIDGDPALAFSGPGAQSPWLSWGIYMWADGLKPRSDGLTWICPDDYLPDGRHPSNPGGRLKVAGLLRDFLMTDETAGFWFLRR